MLTAVESPVRILVASVGAATAPGHWNVTWQVSNLLAEPVAIEDAWVPHGRFRGQGHVAPGKTLAPRAVTSVVLSVASDEPAGSVVENAFLILRLRGAEQAWRVFARMRIEFTAAGMAPRVEAVTAQALH
jgi:hypothetical protein